MEVRDLLDPDYLDALRTASPEELDGTISGLEAIESYVRRCKLAAIAEHDRREQWRDDGCRSEAEWLKFRTNVAWETAAEQARVAKALDDLPAVAAAYGSGRLSFDQVRAVTKLADPDTDAMWAEEARLHTARQLQRMVSRRRPAADEEESTRRFCRFAPTDDDLGVRSWSRLPGADGQFFRQVAEALARRMPADPATGRQDPYEGRLADALIEMARLAADHPDRAVPVQASLGSPDAGHACGPARGATSAGRRSAPMTTVVVHAQAEALIGSGHGEVERGPALGPETIRRLACDGRIQVVLEDDKGNVLDYGRTRRAVSWQLARHLWHRDGGCVAPNCDRTSLCEGHHLRHWAQLGGTDPDNTTLLCWVHHRAVHEGRFRMERTDDGRFRFFRPDGSEIAAGPRGLRPDIARRIQRLLFGTPATAGPETDPDHERGSDTQPRTDPPPESDPDPPDTS